jgi:hypothetical protein
MVCTSDFRRWIRLCENEEDIPRLWLGPKGEVIDLDVEDDSHSYYVLSHEDVFGVSLDAERKDWENEGELDYDTILAKAEQNGWIRISRDVMRRQPHVAAISTNNVRNLQRGIRWLLEHGIALIGVDAEIEVVQQHGISRRFYELYSTDLDAFLQRGFLPRHSSAYDIRKKT